MQKQKQGLRKGSSPAPTQKHSSHTRNQVTPDWA
jgi:hypothetical protein